MARPYGGDWKPSYTKVLILAKRGYSVDSIAKRVGLHPCTVSEITHRPDFIAKREKFDEDAIEAAKELFVQNAKKAAQKITKILKKGTADQRLQFDAAKEILYQVGLKPTEVIETRQREYTAEELASALLVSKELEDISNRLTSGKSQYLVESLAEPPLSAPVPAMLPTDAKPEDGEKSAER